MQKVFLTPAQLSAWGWRIPFVIGALLALVAFIMRRHMEESMHVDDKPQRQHGSLVALWKAHPGAVLTVVGLTMGGTLSFYTSLPTCKKFLVNSLHYTIDQSTVLTFWLMLIYAGMQPLFGWISDHIGRKPLLIAFGDIGYAHHGAHFNALMHANSEAACILAHPGSIVHCKRLHVRMWHCKSRNVPGKCAGIGCRISLCHCGSGVWRHSRIHCPLPEKHRPCFLVLLVRGPSAVFISLLVYIFARDSKAHSYIDKD